jgi:hypothetical protein
MRSIQVSFDVSYAAAIQRGDNEYGRVVLCLTRAQIQALSSSERAALRSVSPDDNGIVDLMRLNAGCAVAPTWDGAREIVRRASRWHDREAVLAEVTQDAWALEDASDALRGDREIVLAAVSQIGRTLEHASDALRGDREIVLAAVSQDAWALEDASAALRGDHDVVRTAVEQNPNARRYARLAPAA